MSNSKEARDRMFANMINASRQDATQFNQLKPVHFIDEQDRNITRFVHDEEGTKEALRRQHGYNFREDNKPTKTAAEARERMIEGMKNNYK